MRVLLMGIAGLFGGFLVALILIAAYRIIAKWITGLPGEVGVPFAYGPETLALVGAITVPVVDALIRRRRTLRSSVGPRSPEGWS